MAASSSSSSLADAVLSEPEAPQKRAETTEKAPQGRAETTDKEHKAAAAETDQSWYLPLHKAALSGDWESAERIFKQDENAITARIAVSERTALHVAAGAKKAIHFLEKLVELMPKEALALPKQYGRTALDIAAMAGNTEAAKKLVEKNPDLLFIKNSCGDLPVLAAAVYIHRDTLSYLLNAMKDNVESSDPLAHQSGVDLVVELIAAGFLDVALELVQRYPQLATLECSALNMLAQKAWAFPSGSHLNFWQGFIYSCIPVKLENCPNKPNINGRDIENPADSSQVLVQMRNCFQLFGGNYFISVCQKLHATLWKVVEFLVPHVKYIREKKWMHHQALHLVKCLCESINNSLNVSKAEPHYITPALDAASSGIHEIVEEIVESFPTAAWSRNGNNQSIFHLAILNRCENVFNLVYQMSEHKHSILQNRDSLGNTILHLAGRLAPPLKLQLVSGAALQMQREIQWFKEVEKFVTPANREWRNHAKETPAMVFSKEHKNLVIEGEKWMKDTATSCTIAAALIVTVVFAAAFTVPGGNKEDGLPIFSEENVFIIFGISNAISLFTSTSSLLMFLSILTSRYAESDFLRVLPKRLIIGLLTLFLSITSMMITFSATLYLVFGKKKAWILIPMAGLACLPVTLFVSLQFPLLVDVISSTYGPGIFRKQSNRPFY